MVDRSGMDTFHSGGECMAPGQPRHMLLQYFDQQGWGIDAHRWMQLLLAEVA